MNRTPPAPSKMDDKHARTGLVFGLLAYGLWGILPIYFKQLAGVSAVDIVAHRIIWSLLFLGLLLAVTRGWGQVRTGLKDRRTLGLLFTTSVLIAANWLLYVYAVTSGHILAGSLGYYLNPLMNILLGRFILKERLTNLQWAAVAVAAAGVSVLAAGAGTTLWISLSLCVTFATYGLLRKVAAVEAVAGLSIETAILFPIALIWLAVAGAGGQPILGSTTTEMWLLILSGIASTTPLLLFTSAARRLRYSTLGMLQFAAPTMQFLVAVVIYNEEFTRAHAIAFASICRKAETNGKDRAMLNLISLIIGVVSLTCAAVAFLPLLGWANWLIIPLAVIGAGIGALSQGTAGRNLNIFVILVGIVRLSIGGGIL